MTLASSPKAANTHDKGYSQSPSKLITPEKVITNNNVMDRFRRPTKSPARFHDFDSPVKPSSKKRKLEDSPNDGENRRSLSKDVLAALKPGKGKSNNESKDAPENQSVAKKAKLSHIMPAKPPALPIIPHSKYATQLDYLEQIVMPALWKNGSSWPFHKPVTSQFDLPDYSEIIKYPMDLGTIKYRMEQDYYKSPEQCMKDFKLMFTNCYTYNKPDSDVWKMCEQLEKCYMSKIAGLPQELKCRPELEVGQKLECEDRANDLVCVATFAEIHADKVRVHFDGWDENYDVWFHPWDAQLHPVGWCQDNGVALSPPRTCKKVSQFTWEDYLARKKAVPAPKAAFKSNIIPYGFASGWKLEAGDPQSENVYCATVVKIQKGELLIHYDGWDRQYDFWCHPFSKLIHPVGYCKEKGIPLSVPKGWFNVDNFTWEAYLKKTQSLPVPRAAFETKKAFAFQEPGVSKRGHSDAAESSASEITSSDDDSQSKSPAKNEVTKRQQPSSAKTKATQRAIVNNRRKKNIQRLKTKYTPKSRKIFTASKKLLEGERNQPVLKGLSKSHPAYSLSAKYRSKKRSNDASNRKKNASKQRRPYQPSVESISEDEDNASSNSTVSVVSPGKDSAYVLQSHALKEAAITNGSKRKTNNSVSALLSDESLNKVRAASLLLPTNLGESPPKPMSVSSPLESVKPLAIVANAFVNKNDVPSGASVLKKSFVSSNLSLQTGGSAVEDESSVPQPVFPPDIVYDRNYKPLGYMASAPAKPVVKETKTVPSILAHSARQVRQVPRSTITMQTEPSKPRQSSLLAAELTKSVQSVMLQTQAPRTPQRVIQQVFPSTTSTQQGTVLQIQPPKKTPPHAPAVLQFQPAKVSPPKSAVLRFQNSSQSAILQFQPLKSSNPPTVLTFQPTKDNQAALIQIQPKPVTVAPVVEQVPKKEPTVAPITIEPQPEMRVTERINSVLSNIQMLSESDVRNIIQISASRLASNTQIELAQMFMRWNHDVLPHTSDCPCMNFKSS